MIIKKTIFFLLIGMLFSCNHTETLPKTKARKINWDERSIQLNPSDSLHVGSSYLSVYSEIYSYSEERTYDLTVTISMKNIYKQDSVFINKAEYFNTQGQSIRTYFNKPIYLKPMETLEIVIEQNDLQGGSGGNFVFDWTVKKSKLEPHFEAVMISTYGQQGLSFTSQGIRVQ